jgi:hypothetical protein
VRGSAAVRFPIDPHSPPPSGKGEATHKPCMDDVGGPSFLSNLCAVRSNNRFGFTPSELRTLRSLQTPAGIQKFLDDLPYNLSYTARSPKKVLDDRVASCLEGGIFAAAALRVIGFPPLIFDLEAKQDSDHVVAIFKVRGHWGAVAKSNFTGCRYREPVYRTLRELAMSYFNIYFNLRGERTLRRYSRPVNLERFDDLNWMTTEKPIWFIAEHLCDIPHISLLTAVMEKNLTRVDRRTMSGEMVGHRTKRRDEK